MAEITEIAVAAWRLEKWLEHVNVERKMAAKSSLRSIKKFLEENEIEAIDLTGAKFDVGLAVSVVNNESEETDEDKLIIAEMVRPIIKERGAVIQYGQVILGDKVKQPKINPSIKNEEMDMQMQQAALDMANALEQQSMKNRSAEPKKSNAKPISRKKKKSIAKQAANHAKQTKATSVEAQKLTNAAPEKVQKQTKATPDESQQQDKKTISQNSRDKALSGQKGASNNRRAMEAKKASSQKPKQKTVNPVKKKTKNIAGIFAWAVVFLLQIFVVLLLVRTVKDVENLKQHHADMDAGVTSEQFERIEQMNSQMSDMTDEISDMNGELLELRDIIKTLEERIEVLEGDGQDNANQDYEDTVSEVEDHGDYIICMMQPDDTLSGLCERNGINYYKNEQKILELNNITDINNIKAGQEIKLPKNN